MFLASYNNISVFVLCVLDDLKRDVPLGKEQLKKPATDKRNRF